MPKSADYDHRSNREDMLRIALFSILVASGAIAHGTERSISERIAARNFPSVFQAWSPADNLPGEGELVTAARHDFIWHGVSWYGLAWDKSPSGLGEAIRPESIEAGLKKRRELLRLNPNVILIAEIRYRDASRRFLPEDHKWWR